MRLGRVIGNVTLNRRLENLKPGGLLIVEAFDRQALTGHPDHAPRKNPMPESLIVFDELGAGVGQLVAISEGAEATLPFRPQVVPIDAYCAAIIDHVETTPAEEITI